MFCQRRRSFCSISEFNARIVGTKNQMQGLFEVVACLSALLPPSLALLVRGSPSKVAAQQFQSEGGQLEVKIQFFSK